VPTACRQALDTKGSQGRPDGAERWRVGIVYKLKKTLTTSSPPLLKRPSEDKEEVRAGSVKLDLAHLLVGFCSGGVLTAESHPRRWGHRRYNRLPA
jgi:hypothetical protein